MARIPVVEGDGTYSLAKEDTQKGKKRCATQLRGVTQGNDLTEALRGDQHLGLFLALPGKDNGFDIEQPSTLRLMPIGPKQLFYRKHFLQLGGLGIRDLCVHSADMLILGGPTMDLDGPVTIFRWPGGADPKDESVIPAEELARVMDVPYGQGVDHAEGMTLFSPDGGPASSLLVVYDSASESRQLGESTMVADVFPMPRASG
jgi:hypothetical protein